MRADERQTTPSDLLRPQAPAKHQKFVAMTLGIPANRIVSKVSGALTRPCMGQSALGGPLSRAGPPRQLTCA
jgi:hypothetical protein